MATKKPRIQVILDEKDINDLKKLSEKNGLSMSSYVRTLILKAIKEDKD